MDENQWPKGEETHTMLIYGIPVENILLILTLICLLIFAVVLFIVWKKRK
jgi:hypothetical protein